MHNAVDLRPLKKMMAVAITVAVVVATCALFVTDLRARAEMRRTTHELASTRNRQEQEQAHLVGTQAQMRTASSEVRILEGSISRSQTSLTTSNATISSLEKGLILDGFDISALNSCLGGVTQALDQVAVGQTKGALSSLGAVSMSCNAARPAAG
jgi:uncharacterized protein YlxW (UPF0749 family)